MDLAAHWRPRVHIAQLPGVPVLPVAAAAMHAAGARDAPPCDGRIYGALRSRLTSNVEFVSSASHADVVLCAHDASRHRAAARAVADSAIAIGKSTFFHSESDDVRPTKPVRGKVFRSSVLASRRLAHEEIATGCVPDLLLERTDSMPDWAPWTARPRLGFIGHVASGLRSIGYLRHGWQHFHGFTLRESVLRAFEASDNVEVRFTRRGTNLGPPMAGTDADEHRREMRLQYVDSVFANSYALCVRGAGNWSYRFFEALSAGRIPVLIDTDCMLPLEGTIDWDQHMCRIPATTLSLAPQMLDAFHRRLGPEGHSAMQARNRELWRKVLSPESFFPAAIEALATASTGNATQPTSAQA